MLKKLSFASGLRSSAGTSSGSSPFAKEKGKIVKYTSYSSKHHRSSDDDDDLDEVAVISNATPENVTYGSGGTSSHFPGGSSSNGPRLVPGIITSTGFESKPYVPATCTMQPKISSSCVIQSTATSRTKKTNTTSSAAYSSLQRDDSHRPTGGGGADSIAQSSSSFAQTTSKPATSSSSSKNDQQRVLSRSELNARASELVDRDIRSPQPIQTISSKVTCATGSSSMRSVNEGSGASSGKGAATTIVAAKTSRSGTGGVVMSSSSASESTELSKKVRDARRKQIKREFEKSAWSTPGSGEKSGCNWSFVFDPSGRLVYYWSMIVSLAFIYNSWVIVYRFAFEEISSDTVFMWLTLDGIADFIYVLDVVVHFRIGYLEEGVLQTQASKLRQHYINSTIFYVDCLCLLPLDFLYLSIGFNSMLRCFRLIKIYCFWSFLDRTERHTNYPNVFRTASLFHYILVLFHWNACVYFLLSQRGDFGSKDWFHGSRDRESCSDVDCDYLHAFYWSTLALTTIGDLPRPRTKAEYIFLVIELVMGLFLLATVLGHVANIVTNVSAARKEFQAKLDAVKTYMRIRRVPEHLKIKVIKWFDYLWMTQKSSDEDKSVGFLPAKLKAEIAIHVHLDTLKRVEIFQNTEAGFLCALVLRLKPVLFSPSDYVCRKGEIGKEMFIVNRGKLQVVADNGRTVLATLRAGSYFGEISILNMGTAGNRRTASVRSVGYSDLFCLSKNDMWDVLKDYPAARVRLEAIAVKRLEKYRKEPLKKISMGRSRSTPGLVESKSQLNLVAAASSCCPEAGEADEQGKRSLPESPLNKGPGGESSGAINSTRRDSDARTSDQYLDRTEMQHRSSSSIIHQNLEQVVCLQASAQVLYPPPPTYTSVACPHPQSTDAVTLPHGSFLLAAPDGTTSTPSFGVTLATPTYHYLSAAGPTSPHAHHVRRTSSPGADGAAGPVSSSAAQQLSCGISPAQSFPTVFASLPPDPRPDPDLRARTPVPGELSQETLIHEIRRLRERLLMLENENTSMSVMLSQQQWNVENRLAEIEQQIHSGAAAAASPAPSAHTSVAMDVKHIPQRSSPPSTTSQSSASSGSSSYDDSERNKESII